MAPFRPLALRLPLSPGAAAAAAAYISALGSAAASYSTTSKLDANTTATATTDTDTALGPLGVEISPSKRRLIPSAGTYPRGFQVSGVLAGVKPTNTTRPDLALLVSDRPCAAAAVFTKNKFQAAPVTYTRDLLARTSGTGLRAVLINAGCANAVTGKAGLQHAARMAATTDQLIGPGGTIVMSTGVIGQPLPVQRIVDAVPAAHAALGSSHNHWMAYARAICTTDTFPKLLSRAFTLPGHDIEYRIAGIAKGAGMIHPNMATLLAVLATDALITPPALTSLLRDAVDQSFNCITIDGDTSTNDTVALLANGAATAVPSSPSSPAITAISAATPTQYAPFVDLLREFTRDLAQLVVRDGEGATKFVTIRVEAAASELDARRVASTIARSPLVKTALYGRDANWGRILCATGYALLSDPADHQYDSTSSCSVQPDGTSVSFIPPDGSPPLVLLADGEPVPMDESRASNILAMEDIEICVRLGTGIHSATYWTCDMSHEYVTINGDYRT